MNESQVNFVVFDFAKQVNQIAKKKLRKVLFDIIENQLYPQILDHHHHLLSEIVLI